MCFRDVRLDKNQKVIKFYIFFNHNKNKFQPCEIKEKCE